MKAESRWRAVSTVARFLYGASFYAVMLSIPHSRRREIERLQKWGLPE